MRSEFDAYTEAKDSIHAIRPHVNKIAIDGIPDKGVARVRVCPLEQGEEHILVQVDERGWAVVTKEENIADKDYFETLHTLLVHVCPSYKASFDAELMQKLLGISTMQGE
jgi:hypothetical protein